LYCFRPEGEYDCLLYLVGKIQGYVRKYWIFLKKSLAVKQGF